MAFVTPRPVRRLVALVLAAAVFAGCDTGPSSQVAGSTSPALRANRYILLSSTRSRLLLQYDLVVYDLDDRAVLPFDNLNSATALDENPTLSPDKRWLVFDSDRNGGGNLDLFAYDLDRREFTALPNVNSLANESDPAFGADGRHLAFMRRFGASWRIQVAQGWPPDSVIQLPGLDAPGSFNDTSPSPDSSARRIAFVSDRAGTHDVLVWDRDSAGVLTLPALASSDDDVEPSLTPDGHYVAFASNRPALTPGYHLYLFDLSARALVPLAGLDGSSGNDRQPALSPDAAHMVFASDRAGSLGLNDVWLYDRASGTLSKPPSLATTGDERQPWLHWE